MNDKSMPRCYHCGAELADVDAPCPNCLPHGVISPTQAPMTQPAAVDPYAEAENDFKRALPFLCDATYEFTDKLARELAIKGFPSRAAIRALRAEVEALTVERDEARACLGAALIQVAPSDDKIIIEHLRRAYELLGGKPR